METTLWPIAAVILLSDFLRYFLAASIAFVLLWVVLRRRLAHRRVDSRLPARKDLWREFGYSVLTVPIFSAAGLLIYVLAHIGVMTIYEDVAQYGWAYWLLSLAGIVLLHDAYFYWTHRAMHSRALFRFVHAVHHRSRNPSPWAAYAFHPLEAAVQAAFLPLVLLVAPLHGTVIGLFLLHMIVRNVLGHSGYEIYPAGAARRPLWRWLTGATHHHLHHDDPRGNYGLYFTWWDRWMNTEQERYRPVFEEISARRPVRHPT